MLAATTTTTTTTNNNNNNDNVIVIKQTTINIIMITTQLLANQLRDGAFQTARLPARDGACVSETGGCGPWSARSRRGGPAPGSRRLAPIGKGPIGSALMGSLQISCFFTEAPLG